VLILEYVDAGGDSPYRDWFEGLNAQAAAKVIGSISGRDTGSTLARMATAC
jgi:hypothetical protein